MVSQDIRLFWQYVPKVKENEMKENSDKSFRCYTKAQETSGCKTVFNSFTPQLKESHRGIPLYRILNSLSQKVSVQS